VSDAVVVIESDASSSSGSTASSPPDVVSVVFGSLTARVVARHRSRPAPARPSRAPSRAPRASPPRDDDECDADAFERVTLTVTTIAARPRPRAPYDVCARALRRRRRSTAPVSPANARASVIARRSAVGFYLHRDRHSATQARDGDERARELARDARYIILRLVPED
jgi:hypothetical protein